MDELSAAGVFQVSPVVILQTDVHGEDSEGMHALQTNIHACMYVLPSILLTHRIKEKWAG